MEEQQNQNSEELKDKDSLASGQRPPANLTSSTCTRKDQGSSSNSNPVGSVEMPDDDIFGESLNLEDTHLNQGFQEGYETGLASGKDDGREVGLKTGFTTGEELGFYRGCIDVWNSVIRVDPTCFSTRVQKNIKEMDDLVSNYPILEPENESVTDIMGSSRLKFRAICATLNVKLEYHGYPKASDPNEIQF